VIRHTHFRPLFAALSLAGALLPQALVACTACAGRSDDPMALGMNMGILALLIVVVSVLAAFAAFAVFLARRAAKFPIQSASTADAGEVEGGVEPDAAAHHVDSISQPTK